LYQGDAQEAHRLLDESLRLCLELKDKVFLARICTYLAEVALWEGELEQAEQWLKESLAYVAAPRRMDAREVVRMWVSARLATSQGQFMRAAMLFGLADAAHSQIQHAIVGPIRALADDALGTVREALEPKIFAEAFTGGQQLSLEEAFATILFPTAVTRIRTRL
jgi:hypothetical protein